MGDRLPSSLVDDKYDDDDKGKLAHRHHHHHHGHKLKKHSKDSTGQQQQETTPEKANDKERRQTKLTPGEKKKLSDPTADPVPANEPKNDNNNDKYQIFTKQKLRKGGSVHPDDDAATPGEIKKRIMAEAELKHKNNKAKQHHQDGIDPSKDETKETNEEEDDDDRAEYASNPNEFTKSGTPMPFWMMEMKKGTEYVVKFHRKYGKVAKHELRPAFKADLDDIDLDVRDSFDPSKLPPNLFEETWDPSVQNLIPVDRLFLTHKVELLHGVCLCQNKTVNDYRVVNYHGHLIYRVTVEKRRGCRLAYIFTDFDGHETMKLEPSCSCCCVSNAKRKFKIYCPLNKLSGFVIQAMKVVCQDPEFFVHDENNVRMLEFYRPKTIFKESGLGPGARSDYVFEYKSIRGQGPLGKISTKLADLKRANFTDFDYYGVHFQEDMSANMKLRIMAAWFVIYLFCYGGKTHVDVHHRLTAAAKNLFEDRRPSVEKVPDPNDELPEDMVPI